jgi:Ca2+-binding EF-hand superfamily protein
VKTWALVKVTAALRNDMYDIEFLDDGSAERAVPATSLRLPRDRDRDGNGNGRDSSAARKPLQLLSDSGRRTIESLQKDFLKLESSPHCEFADMDTEKRGWVSGRDFKSAMRALFKKAKLRLEVEDWLSTDDYKLLVESLSVQVGSIPYDDFLGLVFDKDDNEDIQAAEAKIHRNFFYKKKKADLRKAFAALDKRSSERGAGFLPARDFESVLKKQAKLDDQELSWLARRFQDADGEVDYHLFSHWAFTACASNGDTVRKKAAVQLSKLDRRHVESVMEGLASPKGNLTSKGLERAAEKLGLLLSKVEIRGVARSIDKDDSGSFPMSKVMELCDDSDTAGSKGGSRDEADGRKARRGGGGSAEDTLLSPKLTADMSDAVATLTRNSRRSLWRLLCDAADNADTLSRRQLLQALQEMKVQNLSEDDEAALFNAFDVGGKGTVRISDLVCFWTDLALLRDSGPAARACQTFMVKRRIPAKEVARELLRLDVKDSGYCNIRAFRKAMFAASQKSIGEDAMRTIEEFLDPEQTDQIDLGLMISLVTVSSDRSHTLAKITHCFRQLSSKGVDYKSVIKDSIPRDEAAAGSDSYVTERDLLGGLDLLGLSLLHCELRMVLARCERRGQIKLKAFYELVEGSDGGGIKGAIGSLLGGKNRDGSKENIGLGLFQKICKVRSHDRSRTELRRAILQRDPDLQGHIPKKDFQRVLDRHIDFTDAEAALLLENMGFFDGYNTAAADYTYFLLLLHEPVTASPIESGQIVMESMSKGCDCTAIRRLLALLFRTFRSYDIRSSSEGLIPVDEAEKVMYQEARGVDKSHVNIILKAFLDRETDCINYPEVCSFLSCCSLWYVLNRTYHINQIRLKQGYDFVSHLLKYKAGKGRSRLDRPRCVEMFLAIGIVESDSALDIIFGQLANRDKTLNVDDFVDMLSRAGQDETEGGAARKGRYQAMEIGGFVGSGRCDITDKILKDCYDALTRAVKIAFSIFDPKEEFEVPAFELERIFCSLGHNIPSDEVAGLIRQIDPRNRGVLEYNAFIECVIPFLRDIYENSHLTSLEMLREIFDTLDQGGEGDGSLSHHEIRYVLKNNTSSILDEEIDALISFLDADKDGTLSWEEFKHLFNLMHSDTVNTLERPLRAAIRKVQYSSIPDPMRMLCAFVDVPANYRMSVLSAYNKRINNTRTHSLSAMITKPSSRTNSDTFDEVYCQLRLKKVTGVPSEGESRRDDVVSRGVRIGICRTPKPPTADEVGVPPDFLGNTPLIRAQVHPQYQDKWIFDDIEGLDADPTYYIKVTYTNTYSHTYMYMSYSLPIRSARQPLSSRLYSQPD